MKPPPLLAAAILVAVAACQETATPPAAPPHAVEVQVRAVRRGVISETLAVTGETAALSVLRLASPVAGRVTFLSARPGDALAAGAVAARVISLENDAAVRGFGFLAGRATRSAEERRRARRLQHDLGALETVLRTPFAAVVAERLHNPGEQVAQNDVLLELFDPHSLYALAQVPVESAAQVRTGMPAEVQVGDSSVAGEVTALSPALAPQTLTVPVRVRLSAALQPPLLHAAAEVRITLAQHRDALLVPRSALVSSGAADHGVVMVAADGTARRRAVALGLRTSADIEVLQGLTDGELILTEGQYALPDGTPIEPRHTTNP